MSPAFKFSSDPDNQPNPHKALFLNILNREKLNLIEPKIGRNYAVCQDSKGSKLFFKLCSNTEMKVITKLFPLIRKLGLQFEILELPDFTKTIQSNHLNFIIYPYFDGKRFNDEWSETKPTSGGGRGLDPNMANKVIDLMADLSLVDVSMFGNFDLPTFRFMDWKNQNLPFISEILIERNIVSQDQISKAKSILASRHLFENSKPIITNGDFYPRNLIEKSDGKLIIIDWESKQDYAEQDRTDMRTALVNYLENHIAFFFIHMWGNYRFQKSLISGSVKRFNLCAENLQAGILVKSLEQALIWSDDLARRQIEIFVNALDIGFVKDLMS